MRPRAGGSLRPGDSGYVLSLWEEKYEKSLVGSFSRRHPSSRGRIYLLYFILYMCISQHFFYEFMGNIHLYGEKKIWIKVLLLICFYRKDLEEYGIESRCLKLEKFIIQRRDEKITAVNRTIRMRVETFEKIVQLSKEHGISVNKLLNQCLMYALENLEQDWQR